MRVGERQLITAEKSETAESKRSEKRQSVKKNALGADSVTLSSKAREAAEITLALKNLPDVREGLVRELKAKIDDGSYNVNGKDIVQKLLNETAGSA
ncbi:MAG: flagellar biosynthesis anti-sigma factor FlgM [Deferribacteraceae bacterium]|jgi:negative regulator of flagellin synthesis FlgM|nr:flagellar biosynthesis anti-sigma factor FlgM [Deferribacteraceae bacterium]